MTTSSTASGCVTHRKQAPAMDRVTVKSSTHWCCGVSHRRKGDGVSRRRRPRHSHRGQAAGRRWWAPPELQRPLATLTAGIGEDPREGGGCCCLNDPFMMWLSSRRLAGDLGVGHSGAVLLWREIDVVRDHLRDFSTYIYVSGYVCETVIITVDDGSMTGFYSVQVRMNMSVWRVDHISNWMPVTYVPAQETGPAVPASCHTCQPSCPEQVAPVSLKGLAGHLRQK